MDHCRPSPQQLAGGEDAEHWAARHRALSQCSRPSGEGGMGKVYLAVRADQQYVRGVAIKVMRSGFGSSPVMLGRFRTERQILANLDHPNIARLLDGGVTEQDAPYLVMEYIDGTPIDRYCWSQATAHREASAHVHRGLLGALNTRIITWWCIATSSRRTSW